MQVIGLVLNVEILTLRKDKNVINVKHLKEISVKKFMMVMIIMDTKGVEIEVIGVDNIKIEEVEEVIETGNNLETN